MKGLPSEYLDGRKTKVYEIKNVKNNDLNAKYDLKLWINPKSEMPIKSRMVLRVGDTTITTDCTYLGFDEEIDPKLFDTTIPEGYKEMELPKQEK